MTNDDVEAREAYRKVLAQLNDKFISIGVDCLLAVKAARRAGANQSAIRYLRMAAECTVQSTIIEQELGYE